MKSYIEFKEVPTTTKTKRFEVVSKTDGSKLGEIRWHSPYRKYSFQVTSKVYEDKIVRGYVLDTKIFDTTCMDEISAFIKKLMEEREKK
jgi:hypothetical protein